jgi:hypothetical protein
LVVPSFRNSRYSSLWDDSKGKIAANVAGNLWPAITQYFNTDHDVCVAYPDDHGSFARNLMRHFDVSRVSSNQPYILGDDTYQVTVPDDLKFDAVFLAGIPVNEGEQFNATDIKADFASICTEDFDLIDSYHGQTAKTPHMQLRSTKNYQCYHQELLVNKKIYPKLRNI